MWCCFFFAILFGSAVKTTLCDIKVNRSPGQMCSFSTPGREQANGEGRKEIPDGLDPPAKIDGASVASRDDRS